MKKLLLLISLALALACAETDLPQHVETDESYPDTQLDDANIVFTEDGQVTVRLLAEHIDRWNKQDSTEADTVQLYFYDDNGNQSSSLTADRGLIREKTEKVSVFGNVVAVNEDSTILHTESLHWDPETQLITTEDFVEIERADGDVLTGYGLRGDRMLQQLEILRDVKGTVHKIPESEKEKISGNE